MADEPLSSLACLHGRRACSIARDGSGAPALESSLPLMHGRRSDMVHLRAGAGEVVEVVVEEEEERSAMPFVFISIAAVNGFLAFDPFSVHLLASLPAFAGVLGGWSLIQLWWGDGGMPGSSKPYFTRGRRRSSSLVSAPPR